MGDLSIVETLLAETNNQPTPALAEQLLGAIEVALTSPNYNAPKWHARAFKLRGACLEAIAEMGQALAACDQALALDPELSPNHAWRHTFKAVGFRSGISEKVLDAIVGHAPASVGRGYGEPTLSDKAKELRKFPRYK